MITKIIFWADLINLIYIWGGFVLILFIISLFKREKVKQHDDYEPSVSIIICAYNEAKRILKKIENSLALDYPQEKLEIIVVSDGSTDKTNDILQRYRHPRVHVIIMPEHVGKSACQNRAVKEARNEVLFFTDATTMHPPDALRKLIRYLGEPNVGCVSGHPVFNHDDNLTSDGLCVREKYEFFLRKKLSTVQSLFGAQDCMYIIPKNIFVQTRADLDSGLVGPLELLARGYRTVYAYDALAFIERRPPNLADEFTRRWRIVLRGLRGLVFMRRLLNPFRYGFISIALISSRLLRWMSPIFLLVLFLSNLLLLDEGVFYRALFFGQLLFYGAAVVGYWNERHRKLHSKFFAIPFYFCMVMGAAAVAMIKLCQGEHCQTWQTRR